MYLRIYRIVSTLGGPLIDVYLKRRMKLGKEDSERFPERLGKPGFPRMAGPLVWVHAASVGEAVSVLPLIEALLDRYRDIHVLVTTGTVTSARMLESRLPERAFHQYVPIDKLVTVRRFLKHWRPNVALWVESELWPNLLLETHATGCSMIQINARLSQRSYEKWRRYNAVASRMLSCFSLSLAQSEDDARRLRDLGAANVKYLGNLKYDAPPLPADPKETGRLISMLGDRPMWVAASTHPGEEELLAGVHTQLKSEFDRLLTIIIPRHPGRGREIASLLMEKGLQVAQRSKEEEITDQTQIYIADTIGEMGIFYRMAGIVFMGGSLVPHGGQNPLEPARLECALLTGPHTESFAQIYKELEQQQAVIRARDAALLAEKVALLMKDGGLQETMAGNAVRLMKSKTGILKHYLEALSPYLKPVSHHIADDENA